MSPATLRISPACLAVLLGCLVLSVPRAAVPAEPAKPDTLEKQIEVLEDALAESFRTSDWKMLDMGVQGLKAAGVTGAALETSLLRAERKAALDLIYQKSTRAQIEVWGIATRAKAGDTKAMDALRTLSTKKMAPVYRPDMKLYKEAPKDALAQQKTFDAYQVEVHKQEAAILVLALLKEPGTMERALAGLRAQKPDPQAMMYGLPSSSDTLVLAALASDPVAGWRGLMEFCGSEDKEIAFKTQCNVLNCLTNMSKGPQQGQPMMYGMQMAAGPFTLGADIAATIPKDASAQLVKVFAKVANRAPATEGNQPPDYLLPAMAGNLPLGEDQDALAALEGLKTKATGPSAQWYRTNIDNILAKIRGGGAAPAAGPTAVPPANNGKGVEPIKPPDGF